MDLAKQFIISTQKKLLKFLKMIIDQKQSWPKDLRKAALYSLSGGKRIRPILFLSLCQSKGKISADLFKIALAIELVHTYSLIQDDLPSMDNDDFRRKKPSLHKIFPEGMALLTSDALITEVFSLLAQIKSISYAEKVKLIELFSLYSGGGELIGGQYLDLFEKRAISPKKLNHIFLKKTGSLFILSLSAAGVVQNYSLPPLYALGSKIGLLYQFLDDYSDLKEKSMKKKIPFIHAASVFSKNQILSEIKKLKLDVFKMIQALPYKTDLFQEVVASFFLKKIP